jgi:hypothetical protein
MMSEDCAACVARIAVAGRATREDVIRAPDAPAPRRNAPPATTIRRGYVDHDDALRGGTRGQKIARLAGRVYAARAPRRDAGAARHAGRRRR